MRVAALIVGIVGTFAGVSFLVRGMLVAHSSRSSGVRALDAVVMRLARIPLSLVRDYRRRDRWLSGVAPVTMLLQLVLYAVFFIVALGLVVYGTTDLSLGDSLYQSGSTFTTLGIVLPVNIPSTIVTFVAAFLGLVVIAIFIAYLMGIYGMFAAREATMARVSMYAGEPAWGPEVIARAAVLGRPVGEAPAAASMMGWLTELRLNTQLNPILGSFRSTTADRHWTIVLLALLDTVSLRLAMDLSTHVADDIEFVTEGAVTLGLLNRTRRENWSIERDIVAVVRERGYRPVPLGSVGLDREEWTHGWDEMTRAGAISGLDESRVRARFCAIRVTYADSAMSLADRYHAVRAPWSGARRPPTAVVWPIRAGLGNDE